MRSRSAALGRRQLGRREPQDVERNGERVSLDDVARKFSRLGFDGQRGRSAAAELGKLLLETGFEVSYVGPLR